MAVPADVPTITYITAATAILAFGATLVFGCLQLREVKKTFKLAIDSKTPVIRVSSIKTGQPLLGHQGDINTDIIVEFENFGETPAIVHDIAFEWLESDTGLPKAPAYSHPKPHAVAIRPPKDGHLVQPIVHDRNRLSLTAAQIAAIVSDKSRLWVYGYVLSKDVFGRSGKYTFCARWALAPNGNELFSERDNPPAYIQTEQYD